MPMWPQVFIHFTDASDVAATIAAVRAALGEDERQLVLRHRTGNDPDRAGGVAAKEGET